jgi:hypothetical protein
MVPYPEPTNIFPQLDIINTLAASHLLDILKDDSVAHGR